MRKRRAQPKTASATKSTPLSQRPSPPSKKRPQPNTAGPSGTSAASRPRASTSPTFLPSWCSAYATSSSADVTSTTVLDPSRSYNPTPTHRWLKQQQNSSKTCSSCTNKSTPSSTSAHRTKGSPP
ncbi:hypothetical protein BJX64DRAFT_265368 [Aspergillus heterothallicus]